MDETIIKKSNHKYCISCKEISMDVSIDYIKGKQFHGNGSSEFPTVIDSKISSGGTGLGSTPMELLLMSLASCSGMDIVPILEKKQIIFEKFKVSVSGEQSEETPRVFTSINITYHFWGDKLPENRIYKAIDLVLQKYCPIAVMMKKVATLNVEVCCHPLEE